MKTLLIIADLMSRSQLKNRYQNSIYIKDLEALRSCCEAGEIENIVIDLANQKVDFKEALELMKEYSLIDKTICFYPHIHSDLAEVAASYGVSRILTRGQFFQ